MKEKRFFLSSAEFSCAVSALTAGIAAHLFALVSFLHNYDDIASQPGGYGAGVTSGRWFLEVLGLLTEKLGLNYDLPLINGLILLVMLAAAAVLTVDIFRIRSRKTAALIGCLFVTFPTVTSTMYFRFTAAYYGVAIVLSVLSVWLLRRNRWGLLLSAVCTALSLGIYQAYTPVTIALFVMLLLQQALEGETDAKQLVRRGLYDCLALILGVALYFLCMKLSLWCMGEALDDYRGINTMGQIALTDLPGLLWQAYRTFLGLPFADYCGLAARKIVKLTYLLIYAVSLGLIGYLLAVKVKAWSVRIMACLLTLVFPLAVNFIVIMCPGNWIYTLMVYSFVLVPCLPLVLLECLPERSAQRERSQGAWRKAVCGCAALLAVLNAYYTNVNYAAMYYANRQVENYMNSIVIQVRMTEGFDAEKKWAFLGNIDDPLLSSPWEEEGTYQGTGFTEHLINEFSREDWIENYIGYRVPMAEEAAAAALSRTEAVKAMPCWPSEGSIKVIGDTVVIKFQETAE